MKKTLISLTIKPEEKKELEKVSERLGLSLGAFLRLSSIKNMNQENFILSQSRIKKEEKV